MIKLSACNKQEIVLYVSNWFRTWQSILFGLYLHTFVEIGEKRQCLVIVYSRFFLMIVYDMISKRELAST